jgi:hypothetical protein
MAVAGGNVVKVLDVGAQYGEVRADCVELPLAQSVEMTGWSADGQVGGGGGEGQGGAPAAWLAAQLIASRHAHASKLPAVGGQPAESRWHCLPGCRLRCGAKQR